MNHGQADQLIEFRTAYLRAVATLWGTSDLTQEKEEEWGLLIANNGLHALTHRFDLSVNWKLDVTFSYSLTVGPRYLPNISGGWMGEQTEPHLLTIYLPKHPLLSSSSPPTAEQSKMGELSRALAEFYALRPSPFSGGDKLKEDTGPVPPAVRLNAMASGAPDTDLGSWDAFTNFQGIVVRALSLAWRAEAIAKRIEPDKRSQEEKALCQFLDLLYSLKDGVPQKGNRDFTEDLRRTLTRARNTTAALEDLFAYCSPWNIPIEFVRTDDDLCPYEIQWHPSGKRASWFWRDKSQKNADWSEKDEGLPNNHLALHVPIAPEVGDQPEIAGVALAAYNESGRAYPLTCCAC